MSRLIAAAKGKNPFLFRSYHSELDIQKEVIYNPPHWLFSPFLPTCEENYRLRCNSGPCI